MTTYSVRNVKTNQTLGTGLTIDAAAELMQIDVSEMEWAIDETGVCCVEDLICEAELN